MRISAIGAGLVAAGFLLGACAGADLERRQFEERALEAEGLEQEAIALQTLLRHRKRLYRIGWPILKGGVDFCGPDWTTADPGIAWHTRDSYAPATQPAAFKAFGVDNALRVQFVVPGGPAERAGVRGGDVLIGFNGVSITEDRAGIDTYNEAVEGLEAGPETPVPYQFRRGDEVVSVWIAPDIVCNYPSFVERDPDLNAYATGTTILFTTGMMRFQNDIGIAVIFGHELAHNVMAHVEKSIANQTAGAAGGLFADLLLLALVGIDTGGYFTDLGAYEANLAFSPDFEAEADTVGLYLMARGGYPVDNAAGIWREMASEFPDAIYTEYTHPAMNERYLLLEQVAADINRKIAEGRPLWPDLPADWQPKPSREELAPQPVEFEKDESR